MRQIIKGKLKLRFKKECPYYSTGFRTLEKVCFYKWGWSLSVWSVHTDSCMGEFTDWARTRLQRIFPDGEVRGHYVNTKAGTVYPMDIKWVFNTKYDLEGTSSWQVMHDRKSGKYIGYSHRGACGFGIGDMLFSEDGEEYDYTKIAKYRRKYIWALIKEHVKGDAYDFRDAIRSGIKYVVPFRRRGIKVIETDEEAFQAALNFAKYIS